MSELCPTFYAHDDKIVEVSYTEWEESSPGTWKYVGSVTVNLDSNINRIIFELPIGCFQSHIGEYYMQKGDKFTIEKGTGGFEIVPCTQPAHFEEEIKQTEELSMPQTFFHTLTKHFAKTT